MNKKGIGSKYLWAKYCGNSTHLAKNDENIIKELENKFDPVFLEAWDSEVEDIKIWKQRFEKKINSKDYDKFVKNTHYFLKSEHKFTKTIKIYPLLCSNLTGATTNLNYPHNFLLQHGSCFNYDITSIKFMLHELIHIIQYNSVADKILIDSFRSSKLPRILSRSKSFPPYIYVAREILVHSILSIQTPSYFSYVFPNSLKKSSDIILPNLKNYEDCNNQNQYNEWYKYFRYVSFSSQKNLLNYISNNKQIDKEYTDKLAGLAEECLESILK